MTTFTPASIPKERAKAYLSIDTRNRLRRTANYPSRFPYLLAATGLYSTGNQVRLRALRDRHQGRRCFVIGSGPSINEMNLAPLKNEITFAHNAFFLAHERVGFVPTYTVVEDPLPAEDNANRLNLLTGTTKIFTHDLRYCLKPTANAVYVFFDRYYARYPTPEFPRFSDDASSIVYWGGTVAYMSLQLAYYMGIREIYLIGIDLSYEVPDTGTDSVIKSTQADTNHFDPSYFGPGKRWHHPNVERMARSFTRAGEFLISHRGALYNATLGGNLNTLPRVAFDDLFRGRSAP